MNSVFGDFYDSIPVKAFKDATIKVQKLMSAVRRSTLRQEKFRDSASRFWNEAKLFNSFFFFIIKLLNK